MTDPMESIEELEELVKKNQATYPDYEKSKALLNQQYVEYFRAYAVELGKSEEWFEKWLDECVIIVEPMD